MFMSPGPKQDYISLLWLGKTTCAFNVKKQANLLEFLHITFPEFEERAQVGKAS